MAQSDRPAPPPGRGANPANFVSRIVKDAQQPPDTAVLTGYLGSSSEPGHTRLYFDLQLSSFVEIPDDAILHVEETSSEGAPLAASYVWIRRDATLVHGRPGPERVRAKFLEGPIAQMAGGMAGGMAGVNPPVPTVTIGTPCNATVLQAQCQSVYPCHTPLCTVQPPCMTPGHPVCPTHLCTSLPQCNPTPFQLCLTPGHPFCPTQLCTHPPQCLPTPFQPCQTPGHPFCPTLLVACTHPPHCLPTPGPVCYPTHVCTALAACVTFGGHNCPPPQTPFCPVQSAFCPVQTAVCPVQTLACPIQTLACPIQSAACPQTAGCPFGPGIGGFTPGG